MWDYVNGSAIEINSFCTLGVCLRRRDMGINGIVLQYVHSLSTQGARAQAALLFALQTGLLDGASAASVQRRLCMYLQALRAAHAGLLRQIAATQALPPQAAVVMRSTLEAACAAFSAST